MSGWKWLRGLAAILAFFAIGHTMGVIRPPSLGPAGAVLDTMRSVRFPAMGFERTYLEFYSGFGWSITAGFLFQAVIAYQVSVIGRRDPKQAIPMAVTLLASCAATAVLSWMYFFTAPMVISIVAVACSGTALALMTRDCQRQPGA